MTETHVEPAAEPAAQEEEENTVLAWVRQSSWTLRALAVVLGVLLLLFCLDLQAVSAAGGAAAARFFARMGGECTSNRDDAS